MDLLPEFKKLRNDGDARTASQEHFDISTLTGFMVDAYRINGLLNDLIRYLQSIRRPYLTLSSQRRTQSSYAHRSAVPNGGDQFTEEQRQVIDKAMNDQFSRIDKGISELASVADLDFDVKTALRREKRQKRGLGSLSRWMGDVADKDIPDENPEEEEKLEAEKAHRQGLIFGLRIRLRAVGRVQEHMVESRARREIERNQNALSRLKGSRALDEATGLSPTIDLRRNAGGLTAVDMELEPSFQADREYRRSEIESQMSSEQLQALQAEESTMLKHYAGELEKIHRAQQSVLEISQLQTELTMHLNVQAENISEMVSKSLETSTNVEKGNEQLEKAKKKFRLAQWMFYAAVGTCAFSVGWDLIF